ncbi:retrotransposon protein, putative, ty1-copia subclass [Tanacetum coccineum]
MREFHSCKQEEGHSVSSYVLKMKSYIDNLEHLGHPVSLGLRVSLILISLPKEFDSFVQNYNMHSMRKAINELHAVLKLHEQTLPKNNAPALHAIRAGKNKLAYAPKPKISPPPKREDPAKDSICHQCDDTGLEVGSIRRIQGLDTAYWGFLGVGTTLDIFQNIIFIPYFQYGVLVFWIRRIELYSSVVFGECRHGYAVSSLMDTTIVLSVEDKLNYLEHPIHVAPIPAQACQQVAPEALATHAAWELKTLFAQQAEYELFQTMREFHSYKQEEGQSVSSYVLKMKSYIDNLERLGHPVSLGLGLSLILISLCKEFEGKVQKGNNKHKKPQPQLAARGQNQGKGKNKLAYASKAKIPPTPKREDLAKDSVCHQCRDIGHWKRNCPLYLAELLKNKKLSQGASGSGIFTIEIYTFPNKSWVYDTCCDTHICNTTQGLRGSRKLKPSALSLCVVNSQRATVEAIGSYHLSLPSGLVIVLNNCHYAPSITRGIILVSRLYDDGYVNHFVDNSIQVSRNNMVYFSVVLRDGIFEIDLSDSYTNVSSMYALSNKREKSNLDSALLWHCRLGHISKKRIEKLQHDGLFNSTDLKDFEKCVPCMSEKMARKPYTHQVERAKDLLGLIHIDHKHEVFETFKVFQKEVENQLGKTIKSLRSDRGGKYMSQEFLDHLKDHGIIAHRTPPYTPQHNGVSERRNITLLDMVRSMMSQTTIPKFFWDYALETAACILNMVPTKKVEKTPYEVWLGHAPKLSYLKVWGYEALVKRDTLTKPDKLEPSLITQEASGSLEDFEIIQEEDTHPSIDTSLNHEEDDLEIDEPQSDIIPIRRSTRTRHALDRMCLYIDAEEHELGDLGEPANYKAALLDPKSNKWLNAMNVEMQSMKDNDVWDLVDLHPDGKIIGSKWLFKKKIDMDGAVHTYKAHLVAKGYTQTPWIDYEETCSPVADNRAIRILIAIVAFYDYEIWKMDVKPAFLNGYISEEVYMEQPEGDAAYILGIKIYRDRSRRLISLCQSAYIEKILKRFQMENSKRGSISMQDKIRLSKSQGASTPAELKHIQFQQNPCDLHWTTVKNILKYLRNTKDMFLVYGCDIKRELRVSCYTDAGYLTDADDLKSQSGYVFVLNGGTVDWKSAKQSIFATSSAESEYIAAYDASKEAVWVKKFISGMGVVPTKYVL